DPPVTKMRFNGKEVIGLGIVMAKKGDVIQLGKALEAAAARIQAQLPIGIELEKVSDQPKTVDSAVHEFLHSLTEAVVIVLAV
ncbi:efflux RND transporter permease subunit, partial [Acinetobacter baumannii]